MPEERSQAPGRQVPSLTDPADAVAGRGGHHEEDLTQVAQDTAEAGATLRERGQAVGLTAPTETEDA